MSDTEVKKKKQKKKKRRRAHSGKKAPVVRKKSGKKKKETPPAASDQSQTKFMIVSRKEDSELGGEILKPLEHPDDFLSTADCKRWVRANADKLQGLRLMILHIKGRLSVQATFTAVLKEE